jgi:ABC-2 type transport system permease protein
MTAAVLLGAFIRRDWAINRSYRLDFIVGWAQTLVWFVLFFFIGRFVDNMGFASRSTVDHGYFPFVIVGLVIWNVLSSTISAYQRSLRDLQTMGTLEAMLATPPSPVLLTIMGPSYELMIALIQQLVTLMLAGVLLGVPFNFGIGALFAAIVAMVICVGLSALLGLMLSGITLVVKRGANRPIAFLMSALMLLGGIYFPVTVLPRPMQVLAQCSPITWCVSILREALLNDHVLYPQLLLLILAAIVAVPIAGMTFAYALDHARRNGTLTQY